MDGPGSAWSAAASVEARDRIASSMMCPRTTPRSAQSAPNAATASITARTATCPSQSRVLKLSGLMVPPSPGSQPIADTANRVDERHARSVIDLGAEVAHVDIEEVVKHIRRVVPHPLGEA